MQAAWAGLLESLGVAQGTSQKILLAPLTYN